MFNPSYYAIFFNPFYIIRKNLFKSLKKITSEIKANKVIDVGCGSKPYKDLFKVNEYIGIDVEVSGHNHSNSEIDFFYDGRTIPFSDSSFDIVFSSEVLEHVFEPEKFISEIYRVVKVNGLVILTCPFIWDEHEQPYDFARYTSFGIKYLFENNNFKIINYIKTTNYIETIFQMLSAYLYQHFLPKNKFLKILLLPIFVMPINFLGIIFGKIFPKNFNFYHNNILVAEKLA